ncbi:unnamed protein product, partial [Polarella glacialis]
ALCMCLAGSGGSRHQATTATLSMERFSPIAQQQQQSGRFPPTAPLQSHQWLASPPLLTWHSRVEAAAVPTTNGQRQVPLLPNSSTTAAGHSSAPPISKTQAAAVNRAVRLKALDALAAGGLRPGQELELISALDLGTVPWSEVPVSLKQALRLPAGDKGIDSLALNLTVAVQAKDYTNG